MARRRIIHEEEVEEEKEKKPAFKPQKFDETEFLQTENKSAKMIYISLGIAVVAGIFSFVLMRILYSLDTGVHFTVPLISPVLFAFLVVYLFKRFGIDIKELEWKKWLENGFMFVLAWFVIWMLSMNPPISDFSSPQIQEPVLELKTSEGRNHTYFLGFLYINDEISEEYKPSSQIDDVTQVYVYVPISDNNRVGRWELEIYERSDGDWDLIDDTQSNGINIGKNYSFQPKEKLEDRISDEWIQRESDVWEDHLWTVNFDIETIKNSTLDLEGGLDVKIIYKVWDPWDNYTEKEFLFRVDV